jgi:hypothetical protein
VLEGTRLTVQRKSNPDGFEFTIRTPGTPDRWKDYELEMASAWQEMQAVAVKDARRHNARRRADLDSYGSGASTADAAAAAAAAAAEAAVAEEATYEASFADSALEASLTVFFYWVNFGPLSRGSAACGYAVLRACLAAVGLGLRLPALPPAKQLDWEAILRPAPASFIAAVKPWLKPKLLRRTFAPSRSAGGRSTNYYEFGGGDVLAPLPDLDSVLPTLRTAIEALNAD